MVPKIGMMVSLVVQAAQEDVLRHGGEHVQLECCQVLGHAIYLGRD
jgi:hypothetical protein